LVNVAAVVALTLVAPLEAQVSLTPDNSPLTAPQKISGQTVPFTIRNLGTGNTTFYLFCYPSGWVTACTPSQSSMTIPPQINIPLSATFTTGDTGTGVINLKACDNAQCLGPYYDYGSYNVTIVATRVAVTPDGGTTPPRAANTSGFTSTFTVQNTGTAAAWYNLSCSTLGNVTCNNVTPSSINNLAAGNSTNVTANYTTTAAGVGSVSVTAQSVGGEQPDDGSYEVHVVPYTIATTPDDRAVAVLASQAGLNQTFTLQHAGNASATYNLAVLCTGSLVSSCSSPASVPIAAGASAPVTVTYNSAASGTGRIRLVASNSSNSAIQDSGWVNVSLGTSQTPTVSVTGDNSGNVIARNLCLTFAIGRGVASECGDLRIVHSAATTTTFGKPRTPTLIYNSQHAQPNPLVAAELTLPSAAATPDSIVGKLTVNSTIRGKGKWAGSEWVPGGVNRIVVADTLSPSLATGVYDYTLEVVAWYGGVATPAATATGQYVVVNRISSPFGAGWWLAGVDQLFFPTDPTKLWWVGGDGSFREYQQVGSTNTFRAPTLDRLDSLVRMGTAPSYTYTRYLSHGLRIQFDSSGRHTATINRLGQATGFRYDGSNRLWKILLPPDTTRLYQFVYNSTTALLDSMIAPSVGGVARVTKLTHNGSLVTAIRDPNLTSVSFAYLGTTNRIATRTDRRGTVTTFAYDIGQKVKQSSVDMGTAQVAIVQRFRPLESLGLAASGTPSSVDTALAYAEFDGPRIGVSDTVAVWLDRYGSARRIVNGLGQSTRIDRQNATFPVLATQLTLPNGFVTQSKYDAHGNVDTVIQVNAFGDAHNTLSRYEWDLTWDLMTKSVSPELDSIMIAYDPSNGNRLWQQDGTGAPSETDFYYYAGPDSLRGLYRSMRTPSQLVSSSRDSVVYNGLGNLAGVKTPLGFWTTYGKDNVGRDTLVFSPIDSTGRLRRDSVNYDIADRVIRTKSTGPSLPYFDALTNQPSSTAPETTYVETYYNPEGLQDSVRRWSKADSNGIGTITTRWSYDRAGRVVTETPPGGASDSTVYDAGGKVVRLITRRGYTITMAYDALGRLTNRVLPAASYAVWRPILQGETFTFPYYNADPLNGGLTQTNSGSSGLVIPSETQTFTYDVVGNMLTADNSAALVRRSYNPNGTLVADTLKILPYVGTDTTLHVYGLQYTYNHDGRRITLVHPNRIAPLVNGTVKDHQSYTYYSATGLLRSITDVLGNVYEYTYDTENRISRLDRGAAVLGGEPAIRVGYAYDAGGRDTSRLETRGSAPSAERIHDDTLFYDPRGAITRTHTQGDTTVLTYTGLGKLAWSTGYTFQSPTLWPTERHTPDALGNLYESSRRQGQTGSATLSAYAYQSGTGRLVKSWETTDNRNNIATASDTMFYDAAGSLWESIRSSVVTQGYQYEATESFYDAAGHLRVQDHRACIMTDNWSCSTTWMPDYNSRTAFEEYRYDALGRRILVRTRQEWKCGVNCRNAITRTVWDGDQILYELSSQGATLASTTEVERDTGQFVDQTQSFYFPYGRIVYTHGQGLDNPLGLIRISYSNVLADPVLVLPVANWQGHYDLGWYGASPNYCKHYPDPITGTLYCMEIDWPAPYMWKTMYMRSRGYSGPSSWMGSLIEEGRDVSGQMYRRNRYYDPATGRFTQEDPIGLAGGLNVYGFAAGDPVNFRDPFGLAVCLKAGGNLAVLMVAMQQATNTNIVWEYDKSGQPCVKSWTRRGGKGYEEIQARFGFMVSHADTATVEWGTESIQRGRQAFIDTQKGGLYRADSPNDRPGACGSSVTAEFTYGSDVAHELIGHVFDYMMHLNLGLADQLEAIRIENQYHAAQGEARRCIWDW